MKFPICSAALILAACKPAAADVGEKYEDYAARNGKAVETEKRGEATMSVHAFGKNGVIVVHVAGVIASEAYEGVANVEAAKAILAKQGGGKIAEAQYSFPETHFRTPDGNYRAVYRANTKHLLIFYWPLYSTKVQKETTY